jgi:hypothetical protein
MNARLKLYVELSVWIGNSRWEFSSALYRT